jgi:hypothetical protein
VSICRISTPFFGKAFFKTSWGTRRRREDLVTRSKQVLQDEIRILACRNLRVVAGTRGMKFKFEHENRHICTPSI